jgi:mechanosensitive ion channel-like protein
MSDVELAFRDGVHRVGLAVAGFLPGVLSMLLVLGFALVLAFLVRFALRRSLAGIDFDRRVHRWGLTSTGEWMPKNAPTAVAAHAGFWFVLLVGFMAGLKALGTDVTDALVSRTLNYIPNLLSAGLVFAVGIAVARFLERTALINAVNMQIQHARLLSLGVKWLVVLFTIALCLQELQIGGVILTVSFAIVCAGIVLALSLAVGLGSRQAMTRGLEQRANDAGHRATTEGVEEIHHM